MLVACQNLKRAERVLALEGAAAARVPSFARDLKKVTPKEIRALKKGDPFQGAAKENLLLLDPNLQKSIQLHNHAKIFLKPYKKTFMPESEVRRLIHEAGISTFPRPKGIPKNYKVQISDKGAGMKYVDPNNRHTYVRVMPGKAHSPHPYQQQPYVKHRVNGHSIDKFGNKVPNQSPEAHIPLDEFVYKK